MSALGAIASSAKAKEQAVLAERPLGGLAEALER
jgi:hypothetical protein